MLQQKSRTGDVISSVVSTAKSGKRPLRCLSANEKLDAIHRVHNGESKASVARDIGVPESTLRGWCKNENKISYQSQQSVVVATPPNGVTPPTGDDMSREKRQKTTTTHQQISPTYNNNYLSGAALLLDEKTTPPTPKKTNPKEELARLSVELGLNRPEMYASANTLALLYHNFLQGQKVGGTQVVAAGTTPTTQPTKDDCAQAWQIALANYSTANWLLQSKPILYQQLTKEPLGAAPIVPPDQTPPTDPAYKTSVSGQHPSPSGGGLIVNPVVNKKKSSSSKNVLHNLLVNYSDSYRQNTENVGMGGVAADSSTPTTSQQHQGGATKQVLLHKNRVRAVLDDILLNNNNTVEVDCNATNTKLAPPIKVEPQPTATNRLEALQHGEVFLNWLETFGGPSVTFLQLSQFKSLLEQVKKDAAKFGP